MVRILLLRLIFTFFQAQTKEELEQRMNAEREDWEERMKEAELVKVSGMPEFNIHK